MKVLICLNGDPPSKELLKSYLSGNNKIIACDGAGNYLYEYNINPDILIGDFDSINPEALEYFKNKNILIDEHSKIKDHTDGELGIKKSLIYNPTKIIIFGAFGGRVDQLLGNIGLLRLPLKLNIKSYLIGENTVIFLKDRPFILKYDKNTSFSLFPMDGEVKKLCINGGKYDLHEYNLRFGDTRTISNEMVNKDVEIIFESGILGIILNKNEV